MVLLNRRSRIVGKDGVLDMLVWWNFEEVKEIKGRQHRIMGLGDSIATLFYWEYQISLDSLGSVYHIQVWTQFDLAGYFLPCAWPLTTSARSIYLFPLAPVLDVKFIGVLPLPALLLLKILGMLGHMYHSISVFHISFV